jgi:UDP-glucose 4-epimerase
MPGMKVLITGGAGFIGSHLAQYWTAQPGTEVRVLDNFRTGFKHNLAGLDAQLLEGSILDADLVKRAVEGVDYVFHLAALVSVPESVERPRECLALNCEGLFNVLEASAAAGVKKLVFSSSAAVYGNNPLVPKVETMIPEPRSPYAVTKLDGEFYCGMFNESGRLRTACLRYFNVFGPGQDPRSAYAAAVPIFICKALRGEPLRIFGDGGQTRDFVYVKDIVRANVFAATTPDVDSVYNVGYGESITIKELAEWIVRDCGTAAQIEHGPERAGDVRHSLASADKLAAAGLKLDSRLREGVAETLRWYKENLGRFQ